MSPWVPNDEQIQIWKDLWDHPLLYVLKVRQIGASTAVCLDDVLWCSANDSHGNPVRLGIVVDTDAKAAERVRICADFARQLGLKVKYLPGQNKLVWPGGSEIIGMTAGGRRAGASMTFHRIHATELPFWQNPLDSYGSLMQALIVGGRVVIETTMGIDDLMAKELWVRDNEFFKRFFSFEEHLEYRREVDDSVLTPDTWAAMQEEGFTIPEAAMHWQWLLRNRCGGDEVLCYREYPQKPEHSWLYAEGRWVHTTPEVREPIKSLPVPGTHGRMRVDIWKEAADGSGHFVLGVDTAGGLGLDASAVALIDHEDGELCASFSSESSTIDDLVQVVMFLQGLYTSLERLPGGVTRPRTPLALVETNGIGRATIQAIDAEGGATVEVKTNKASGYDSLQLAKRYVEAGILAGPQRLADECEELRVDEGKFIGPKDLLISCGFCYYWMAQNPYRPDNGSGPSHSFYDTLERMERARR